MADNSQPRQPTHTACLAIRPEQPSPGVSTNATTQRLEDGATVGWSVAGSFSGYLILVAFLGLSPRSAAMIVLCTMWTLFAYRYWTSRVGNVRDA